MPSFKEKFSGVTILQGVEFSIFPINFEWVLQQCSATALPVIIIIIIIIIICPIAIAYSMGQITKSFCVCACVCVCLSVDTLTVAFLRRFSPNWTQTCKPPKVERVRWGSISPQPFPYFPPKNPHFRPRGPENPSKNEKRNLP